MAENKFKGISVITAGPALGHDMIIDETTLEQVADLGNRNSPVKVLANHSNDVGEVIGMLSNFRISAQRVRADFELLENHPQSDYFAELLTKLPDQLGFSISFSGVPRVADDGTQLADVRDLWSVDLVTRAAANKSIYEGPVDSKQAVSMNKAETAPVAKLEAPVEVAPATPAAPAPAAFSVEAAFSDLRAELKAAFEALTVKLESRLSAVVVEDAPAEDAPADDEPVAEPAPEPVAAEAKAETTELAQPAPSVIAAKMVELEASRGVKPLEVSTETNFSRSELMAQFNAEKNNDQRQVLLKKILAR